MNPNAALNPSSWVAAFPPVTATRAEWAEWWAQAGPWEGSRGSWRDANQMGILDHATPAHMSRFNKDAPVEDPGPFLWTLDALLDEPDSAWLFQPSHNHQTVLIDLIRWFSDGSWVPCRPTTEEGAETRRRLFRKLMAAVPPSEKHRFSWEESGKAREGYRELGSAALGVAYSLGTWEIAAELETQAHQTPDGPSGCRSPMHRAGIDAWTRAVGQGWDPMEPLEGVRGDRQPWDRTARKVRRWERWLGPRYVTLNEKNDPLRQHVVPQIKECDPEGHRFWMAESVASNLCNAKATDEAEWDEAWHEWRAHPDWNILFHTRNGLPVWFEALLRNPRKSWPLLQHHLSDLVEDFLSLRLDPDQYLWKPLLRDPVRLKALQAFPNPGRGELLKVLVGRLWPGRLSNLMFNQEIGPLNWPDSDTRRWLCRLPAEAFWGKSAHEKGHARLLGDQPRERRWRQQVVAVAHIHQPFSGAFQSSWPAVALCAVAQKDIGLLTRVVESGLTIEDFRAWFEWAQGTLDENRGEPHPKTIEWAGRVERAVLAHALNRSLDQAAPSIRVRF